ncbi:MAG TPA: TIGR03009 domain-containing protein [Gemmataceae bacterium]|nr:TIGR03009 domain-containing protein [Gemmataceae bacterium]
MRSYGLALAALMLVSYSALAQQTPAAPPAAADDKVLDGHLAKWEAALKKVETLGAQLTRIDKDPTFDHVQKLTGTAYYMRTGSGPTAQNLALLELKVEGQKEPKEKFICTGTYIYQFLPEQKEIRYYELPKPKQGQVAEDNNLLSLLFGMKAEDAKKRYELKLAKEDTYYIYVDITPRSPADRADFQRARLILNKSNYLPRQLWFEHANRSEVMWDIPNLQVGMALDRRSFDAPKAPPGWKLVPGENRRQIVRPARPTAPAGK